MWHTLITQSYLIMHFVTIRSAVWFIKMQRITHLLSHIYETESRESVIWSVVCVKPLAVVLHKRLTPYKSLRWRDHQGNCHDRKFNWTNNDRQVTVTKSNFNFRFLQVWNSVCHSKGRTCSNLTVWGPVVTLHTARFNPKTLAFNTHHSYPRYTLYSCKQQVHVVSSWLRSWF